MAGQHLVAALLLYLILLSGPAAAGVVRIAVAANFSSTLDALAAAFGATTGHRVQVSSASTGKHYAQIRNGAGFDVFLAADAERPRRLERDGVGVAGSRFVYAEGRLVLWSPGRPVVIAPADLLAADDFRHLAVANPRLAPYGLAAQQVLRHWGLWERLQPRLVRGENIAQAFQFVATGNAELGLVALSQVLALDRVAPEEYVVIPRELHAPISQQVLLLRPRPEAEAFMRFLRGPEAAAIIRSAGYMVPGRP